MKIIIILTLFLGFTSNSFARGSNQNRGGMSPRGITPPAAYPPPSAITNTPSNASYIRNTGIATQPSYLQHGSNTTNPNFQLNREHSQPQIKRNNSRINNRRNNHHKEDFIPVYYYNEINYNVPEEAKAPETNREKAFKSNRYEAFGEKR